MPFKTLDHLHAMGQRILLRVDMNVPIKNGQVTDIIRLEKICPTIIELADKGGKVVLLSHLGRPDGQKNPEYSLKPVADALQKLIPTHPVTFCDDLFGLTAKEHVQAMKNGDILILENVRFYRQEEENNLEFAQKIAALGDVYVNDAFSVSHRAHATTECLAELIPAYAGRLMEAELTALHAVLNQPKRPVLAVIGGSKISTKLGLLRHLSEKVDMMFIGGGMANTLLFANGVDVGASLCEKNMVETAREILIHAKKNNCQIFLPVDAVVAPSLAEGQSPRTVDIHDVPADQMILDIGPKTVAQFGELISKVPTCVWNGPVGAFEVEPFDQGTVALAKLVKEHTEAGTLLSVAGGGDTVAALVYAGVMESFSYVSTAGGAFLQWLEGEELPGVAALMAKK